MTSLTSKCAIWLLCLSAFSAAPVTLAQLIPAERRMDWQSGVNVGVPGGVPARTVVFTNLATMGANTNGLLDASALLRAAIAACPSGQVVYLPAGTYSISNVIQVPHHKSGVTIRGAGPGRTILKSFTGSGNGALTIGSAEWPRPIASIAVMNGATNGSTILAVKDTAPVVVGRMIRLQQSDPNYVRNNNGQSNTMSMLFLVTAKTPTSISVHPQIPFTFTNSPQIAIYPSYLISSVGVEDLTMDLTNSASMSAIFVEQSFGCWVKNIEVVGSASRQLMFYWSINAEIRDSLFRGTRGGGPNREGIDFYENVCWSLIENNISDNGGFPSIVLGDSRGGCVGNVIAYNYSQAVNSGTPLNGADFSANHGPHNMLNLFEGNVGGMFQSDGYYGSASHNTLFRNHFSGTNIAASQHFRAISLERWSYFFNVIGNVLGHPGFRGGYSVQSNSYPYTYSTIYRHGYPNMGNNAYSGTNMVGMLGASGSDLDLNVTNTLLLHGNFDYVTGATQWDNQKPERTLPASLYLSAKPPFFGTMAWPPIGPDLNPMIAPIPAQLRHRSFPGGISAPRALRLN